MTHTTNRPSMHFFHQTQVDAHAHLHFVFSEQNAVVVTGMKDLAKFQPQQGSMPEIKCCFCGETAMRLGERL